MKESQNYRKREGHKQVLRKIIHAHISSTSLDKSEFNELAGKILNLLESSVDQIEITRVLESELCITFGFYKSEFNAVEIASEIRDWWNYK